MPYTIRKGFPGNIFAVSTDSVNKQKGPDFCSPLLTLSELPQNRATEIKWQALYSEKDAKYHLKRCKGQRQSDHYSM